MSLKNNNMENFIRTYNNVLSASLIEALIQYINIDNQGLKRNEELRQDKQLSLEPFYPDLAAAISQSMFPYLMKYFDDFCILKGETGRWVSGQTIVQKTNPGEGYHVFHSENTQWHVQERVLAWMIYLNDIEDGGETEFLYQNLRIKPEKSKLVIWPGGFTHTHRGNPPLKETKYIVTGWFSPGPHLNSFEVKDGNLIKYM